MDFIDTHVHLTMSDYETDFDGMLGRAKAADVTRYVAPGLDSLTSKQVVALSRRYKAIIPAIGLHPLSPDEDGEIFTELAALPEVKAIGEVGTDAKAGDWDKQEARLRFFIKLADTVKKPLLIHIRDTWEPTLAVLRDYPDLRGRAVIHCFTGDMVLAEKVAELGLLLSFTAILARPGLAETREVVKTWPLEQMMLETDGPWLAWPGENWPNEPATVRKVAELIAELKQVSLEEVAKKTTKTAEKFFNFE